MEYFFDFESHKNDKCLTDIDARLIIEDVLDTLIEVGNGVTDEELHYAADKLFKFRDAWLNQAIKERN